MSFALETKNELITVNSELCCSKAELSSILRTNGRIISSGGDLKYEIQFSYIGIARKTLTLLKDLYDIKYELITKKQMKLKKNNIYIITIIGNVKEVLTDLKIPSTVFITNDIIDESLIKKECCRRAYIRGAFLAAGSINNPHTINYHLEIYSHSEDYAIGLKNIINYFNLNAKVTSRRNGFITYLKEAEKIGEFLRIVDATRAFLDYEGVRIEKDFYNSMQRISNCDIANQIKTNNAANRQIDEIESLLKIRSLDSLPKSIQEAILLRQDNPECSLSELSELSSHVFQKSISKSALNHRFRKITEILTFLESSEEDE